MYLNGRQINIMTEAFVNYDFIKDEINNKIGKGYDINELANFLMTFKDVEITNLDKGSNTTYLDFIYKNVNMFVEVNNDNKTPKVGNTFEIYDDEKQEYIVEDWLTKHEYMYEIGIVLTKRFKEANKYIEEHLRDTVLPRDYEYKLRDILNGDE